MCSVCNTIMASRELGLLGIQVVYATQSSVCTMYMYVIEEKVSLFNVRIMRQCCDKCHTFCTAVGDLNPPCARTHISSGPMQYTQGSTGSSTHHMTPLTPPPAICRSLFCQCMAPDHTHLSNPTQGRVLQVQSGRKSHAVGLRHAT